MNSYCQTPQRADRTTVCLGGLIGPWFAADGFLHREMPKSSNRNPEVTS